MLRVRLIEENDTNPLLIKRGTCIYGGSILEISTADGLLKVYDCAATGDIADEFLIDIIGIDKDKEGTNRIKGGMQFGVDERSSCLQITRGIVAELTGASTLGVIAFK